MPQKIRIIGGAWRGRKIAVPEGEVVRPTPNRVRETLFNWLNDDVVGARCLDLFAGSGALGFEAVSRGATHTVFVEQDAAIFQLLSDNAAMLAAQQVRLCQYNAMQFLQNTEEVFDVIFLDPPFSYAVADLEQLLSMIATRTLLQPNGLLYLESAHPLAALSQQNFCLQKLKKAGRVHFALLAWADVAE